jgi:flagella basal body P-ring formation protein FlgA
VKISAPAILFLAILLTSGFYPEAAASDGAGPAPAGNISALKSQEQRLRDAYIGYICSHLGKAKDDVVLSRFAVSGNETLPDGEIFLEPLRKGREDQLHGYVRLAASAGGENHTGREIVLSGWVDVYGPVVCASRNLKKGEIIAEGDMYLKKKCVTRLSRNTLTDMKQAAGLMLKNDLIADDPLKEWMLKKTAVVNRGEIVTILAEFGGISITVPGKILEKGGLGESVKVQNLMSKKNIYAKIIDGSTVRIDF